MIYRAEAKPVDRFDNACCVGSAFTSGRDPDPSDASPVPSRIAMRVLLGCGLVLLLAGVVILTVERGVVERIAGALLLVWSIGTVPAAWRLHCESAEIRARP